jgi:putative ABC transport system permease protein
MRTWFAAVVRHRTGRLLAAAAGVALAVALLATLGGFLAASRATMTSRATATVPVDWQVQAAPGADPAAVETAVSRAPGTDAALPVTFAQVPGLTATTRGTTQTTGAGVVLRLPPGYRSTFPDELRTLVGDGAGVVVAQQTAANLQVGVGDTLQIVLPTGAPAAVRVDGVVDLPDANSLFQRVGAPPTAQPVAPPDNVVILPQATFDTVLAPLASARPDLLTHQVHAARTHHLPPDPAAAYVTETGQARHLEVVLAGAGVVGDNLGATLGAAREDAAYAQVLFLLLAAPGAALAGLLTAAVASSGATRRRREQSLLRTRGASRAQVLLLAGVEALAVAVLGAPAGLVLAAVVSRWALGVSTTALLSAWPWLVAAVVVGALTAAATVVLPVRRDLREVTVAAGRARVGRPGPPLWMRWYVDLVLLALAGLVFWVAGRAGYSLVLAPEGVPTISVSYWALTAPALLWIGAGLLVWRLVDLLLRRGRPVLAVAFGPLAGPLAPTVAASLGRQRRTVAKAVVLLALAVAFAVSTATFNATYRHQAEVDARLTNGADVAVTEPPGTRVGPAAATELATVPGVRGVEPLQHRYAYVGADLQDLYGVRPTTVTDATSLQDAYFRGGTARELMRKLQDRPDAVLVSQETVTDFQLNPGDHLTLRLQDASTQQYLPVSFTYVGVAQEFPTAPSDSFLVANASYVAAETHNDAVGTFLVDTGGSRPARTAQVAHALRDRLGASATVTDITSSRTAIASSLTSVDLAGLTMVELAFALMLAAAAGGLLLGLGLTERRRTFALAAALGARGRQLTGFILAEAALVAVTGLALGALTGTALVEVLVKVLTGVFDPAPTGPTVPWAYLLVAGMVVLAAIALAVAVVLRTVRRSPVTELARL